MTDWKVGTPQSLFSYRTNKIGWNVPPVWYGHPINRISWKTSKAGWDLPNRPWSNSRCYYSEKGQKDGRRGWRFSRYSLHMCGYHTELTLKGMRLNPFFLLLLLNPPPAGAEQQGGWWDAQELVCKHSCDPKDSLSTIKQVSGEKKARGGWRLSVSKKWANLRGGPCKLEGW